MDVNIYRSDYNFSLNNRHSPGNRKNVVAATIPSPFEGIEQISHRRPDGMAITFASSVPGDNLPVGKKGEKDSAGNLGVHQHLGGVLQTP